MWKVALSNPFKMQKNSKCIMDQAIIIYFDNGFVSSSWGMSFCNLTEGKHVDQNGHFVDYTFRQWKNMLHTVVLGKVVHSKPFYLASTVCIFQNYFWANVTSLTSNKSENIWILVWSLCQSVVQLENSCPTVGVDGQEPLCQSS